MAKKKEERVCTCGHGEGEHKHGKLETFTRPYIRVRSVFVGNRDTMTDLRTKEPIGCTKCTCIAFRMEEARLLR